MAQDTITLKDRTRALLGEDEASSDDGLDIVDATRRKMMKSDSVAGGKTQNIDPSVH